MLEVHVLNSFSNSHHHQVLQSVCLNEKLVNVFRSPVNDSVDLLLFWMLKLIGWWGHYHHSVSFHLFCNQILSEYLKSLFKFFILFVNIDRFKQKLLSFAIETIRQHIFWNFLPQFCNLMHDPYDSNSSRIFTWFKYSFEVFIHLGFQELKFLFCLLDFWLKVIQLLSASLATYLELLFNLCSFVSIHLLLLWKLGSLGKEWWSAGSIVAFSGKLIRS